MLKSNPRTWATMIIRGENLQPEQVTEKLGLNPHFSIRKDVRNLHEKESQPHWQLNSGLSPSSPLEDHIYDILKKIAPKRKEFKLITEQFLATIYASVEFSSMEVDGIHIRPRLLLLLGDLGVHLEFLPWLEE